MACVSVWALMQVACCVSPGLHQRGVQVDVVRHDDGAQDADRHVDSAPWQPRDLMCSKQALRGSIEAVARPMGVHPLDAC